ncbi:MAG: hypothetical protein ACOVT5_05070 [Armatimonadaceae bacterium]
MTSSGIGTSSDAGVCNTGAGGASVWGALKIGAGAASVWGADKTAVDFGAGAGAPNSPAALANRKPATPRTRTPPPIDAQAAGERPAGPADAGDLRFVESEAGDVDCGAGWTGDAVAGLI